MKDMSKRVYTVYFTKFSTPIRKKYEKKNEIKIIQTSEIMQTEHKTNSKLAYCTYTKANDAKQATSSIVSVV